MEPIHYLRTLRRRWWVIAVSVLVAVGAALVASAVVPAPKAQAQPAPSGFTASKTLWDPGAPIVGVGSPISNPTSLAGLVTSPNVALIAAKKMHYQGNPFDLSEQVRASGNLGNGFVTITATGKDLQTAQAVADAFSQALISYLGKLKNAQIDQQEAMVREQIALVLRRGVDPSLISTLQGGLVQLEIDRTAPITLTEIPEIQRRTSGLPPVQPVAAPSTGFKAPKSLPLRLLLAALFGLLAGIVLALVLERFDTRIRSAHSAEEAFGLPVLAEIPAIPRGRRGKVVTAIYPSSPPADAFRLLGAATSRWTPPPATTSNGNASPAPKAKTILVASPEARDGRTTVAANLAVAHAQAGSRVLVVSADLRQPSIHKAFGTADRPGLADLLETVNSGPPDAQLDLAPYLEPSSVLRVGVLPGGKASGHAAELLGSAGMRRLIERLKTVTDVVIFDCASLGMASDVVPLLPQADGVVLVARAGKTRRELAASTTAFLQRMGVTRAGVVLNDTREFAIPPAKRRSLRSGKMGKEQRKTPGESDRAGGSSATQETWTNPGEEPVVPRPPSRWCPMPRSPEPKASTERRPRLGSAMTGPWWRPRRRDFPKTPSRSRSPSPTMNHR